MPGLEFPVASAISLLNLSVNLSIALILYKVSLFLLFLQKILLKALLVFLKLLIIFQSKKLWSSNFGILCFKIKNYGRKLELLN